jgi:hypothetical protein
MSRDIKFISYDGGYPNLCRGVLVYSVDGEQMSEDYCLDSGGTCGFTKDWEDYVTQGPWSLDEDKFPHLSKEERSDLLSQINIEVRHGCCGGCL